MIDIDHFKSINDQYGHQTGDEVLKSVTRTLRENIRSTDQLFRYGGEEFTALLPATDAHAALHVAEKLRTVIAAQLHHNILVTISIGLAAATADTADTASDAGTPLVSTADTALYSAKNAGRNRVEIYA